MMIGYAEDKAVVMKNKIFNYKKKPCITGCTFECRYACGSGAVKQRQRGVDSDMDANAGQEAIQ